MELVRIEAVESQPAGQRGLVGGAIEMPAAGDTADIYSFNVRGWAQGGGVAVSGFQVLEGERLLAEVPPNLPAPESYDARPDEHETAHFQTLVRAVELVPCFSVDVVAVLEDGARHRIGTISGSRPLIAVPRTPAINPVMLTTIGRSGSKWLAWLLSCHPEIVAFQPLVFEPRVATYWATVLRSLTAPRSYLRQIHTERWEEPRWWLGDKSGALPAPVELGMAQWLGADAVHEIAALCQERVEAFYLEVARRSSKRQARYFVEKFLLDPVLLDLTLESFPGAREVILVRDLRDRLSSVFAWNEKRGETGFGHEAQMSKAEYLTQRALLDGQELLGRWRRRAEHAHLVRYEDLIARPHETLQSLFGYLDLPADMGTVEGVLEIACAPSQMLDNHRTVSDPSQTIGRWRRDLSPELVDEVNEVLGPVLTAFGYETQPAGVGAGG